MNQRNAQGQTPLAVAQLNKQEAAPALIAVTVWKAVQPLSRPPFSFSQPMVHKHSAEVPLKAPLTCWSDVTWTDPCAVPEVLGSCHQRTAPRQQQKRSRRQGLELSLEQHDTAGRFKCRAKEHKVVQPGARATAHCQRLSHKLDSKSLFSHSCRS